MSSYVVDNKTINRIVDALEWGTKNSGRQYPNPRYIDESLLVFSKESGIELGNRLYKLNVAAINHRYPDTVGKPNNMPGSIDENGSHVPYKRVEGFPGSNKYQVLKSVQCLIYQCSEGDIPEHGLYKALRQYEFALCRDIVEGIPAYEKASWGG